MRYLLTTLILLLHLFASAYTITTVPRDAAHPFGYVIVRSDKPTDTWVQFLPGIGEKGNGSINDLKKISTWDGFDVGASFFAAADYFGFNIILVQTASEYQNGEIDYGYEQAKAHGADQVHLAGLSLGGFGIAREVGRNPDMATRYATITFFAMGNGTVTNTARNLAASGRPIWFFASKDDNVVSYTVTEKLYTAVKVAGGHAWYTLYNAKGHNGTFTAVAGAWHTPKGQPGGWSVVSPQIATGTNTTEVSWYGWMLNNRIGGEIKSPGDPLVPYTPPTSPPVTNPAQIIRVIELYSDGTYKER